MKTISDRQVGRYGGEDPPLERPRKDHQKEKKKKKTKTSHSKRATRGILDVSSQATNHVGRDSRHGRRIARRIRPESRPESPFQP